MKRRNCICFVVIMLVMISLFVGCQRPRDELVESIASPDGNHVMKIYRNNGGATVDWSTTVSIQDAGSMKENNIYFHYHEKDLDEAVWVDNDTVRINGMELNIHNDYFESFELK